MGKKKEANAAIGRSIIKSHQKKPRSDQQKSWHHTSELEDGYNWNRINLNSVTDQNSLDDFLSTAELAGTEFTAEKLNIKVIGQNFSGLPSVEEEVAIQKAQVDNKELLSIPRRPHWDSDTTASELESRERDSFLSWRRQLASLQEKEHVVLTPFERNLEFWRQLWRVIERSDVVVQIVDARNPLLFRCEDLEKYVKEVGEEKENFILLSKADLLTREQRDAWAEYFTEQGIRVAFWSAIAETERIKQLTEAGEISDDGSSDDGSSVDGASGGKSDSKEDEELNNTESLPGGIPEHDSDNVNLHVETSNTFQHLQQNLEDIHIKEDSNETDNVKVPQSDRNTTNEYPEENSIPSSREIDAVEEQHSEDVQIKEEPHDTNDIGKGSQNKKASAVKSPEENSIVCNRGTDAAVEVASELVPSVSQGCDSTRTSAKSESTVSDVNSDEKVDSGNVKVGSALGASTHKTDSSLSQVRTGGSDDVDCDLSEDDGLSDSDDYGGINKGVSGVKAGRFNSGELVTGKELLEILRSVHSERKITDGVTTIGMVGYPNVGKSSTINALLQQKKVPVSATPGRTKHFQTLFVEPSLCLCDCPGLVMPSFVSSKAEMVINGILPVDQLRDFTSPISLICQMIPRRVLERFYKINIIKPKEGEDPNRPPTALEFLNAYAYNRGFMTQKGVPDSRKVSLLVLKDFVKGRLLYRTPPPGMDDEVFGAVDEPEAKAGDDRANPMVPTITAEGTQQKQMTSETLDAAFFHGTNSTAHRKGLVGTQGLRKVGGRVVYTDQTGAKQGSGKPWKKHGNKNKKEKLRRTYKHLDVK